MKPFHDYGHVSRHLGPRQQGQQPRCQGSGPTGNICKGRHGNKAFRTLSDRAPDLKHESTTRPRLDFQPRRFQREMSAGLHLCLAEHLRPALGQLVYRDRSSHRRREHLSFDPLAFQCSGKNPDFPLIRLVLVFLSYDKFGRLGGPERPARHCLALETNDTSLDITPTPKRRRASVRTA